tara:strand:- start:5771 stop:6523 length:753 start_codon:yes stop_codon:yes gene_type:complete
MKTEVLNPELILNAYAQGVFPMADDKEAEEVYWYAPKMRGQLSIDNLHVPRRLRKTVRQAPYEIWFNRDFEAVIQKCADVRAETWINDAIKDVFTELHHMGFAHSVEAWNGNECVGGLYGLALGGAFFGESMFSTQTDASKIALVHLAAHLNRQGFEILDTQFVNDHLMQFGVYEVPQAQYIKNLRSVIGKNVSFTPSDYSSNKASSSSSESVSSSDAGSSALSSSSASVSFASDAGAVELLLQSITQTS